MDSNLIVIKDIPKGLKHPDWSIRSEYVKRLSSIKARYSIRLLARILKNDNDVYVRQMAAKALCEFRDREAARALIIGLSDPTGLVSHVALDGLSFFDDPKLIALIEPLATSCEPRLRQMAALALGRLACREGLPLLAQLLEDQDEEVAICAVLALERMNHPERVDLLVHVIESRSGEARMHAVMSLDRIGDPRAIIPLENLLSSTYYIWDIEDAIKEVLKGLYRKRKEQTA